MRYACSMHFVLMRCGKMCAWAHTQKKPKEWGKMEDFFSSFLEKSKLIKYLKWSNVKRVMILQNKWVNPKVLFICIDRFFVSFSNIIEKKIWRKKSVCSICGMCTNVPVFGVMNQWIANYDFFCSGRQSESESGRG